MAEVDEPEQPTLSIPLLVAAVAFGCVVGGAVARLIEPQSTLTTLLLVFGVGWLVATVTGLTLRLAHAIRQRRK